MQQEATVQFRLAATDTLTEGARALATHLRRGGRVEAAALVEDDLRKHAEAAVLCTAARGQGPEVVFTAELLRAWSRRKDDRVVFALAWFEDQGRCASCGFRALLAGRRSPCDRCARRVGSSL